MELTAFTLGVKSRGTLPAFFVEPKPERPHLQRLWQRRKPLCRIKIRRQQQCMQRIGVEQAPAHHRCEITGIVDLENLWNDGQHKNDDEAQRR